MKIGHKNRSILSTCYISANRRWFLLVFALTQSSINAASNKKSNLISILYFFKLQKISHENRPKLARLRFGQNRSILSTRGEMLYLS